MTKNTIYRIFILFVAILITTNCSKTTPQKSNSTEITQPAEEVKEEKPSKDWESILDQLDGQWVSYDNTSEDKVQLEFNTTVMQLHIKDSNGNFTFNIEVKDDQILSSNEGVVVNKATILAIDDKFLTVSVYDIFSQTTSKLVFQKIQ
ncbi:MAG: hypothetical protein R2753_13155 [Chitinophagales bacterium]